MTTIIQVNELHKTYPMGDVQVQALKGISFQIQRGEFVAVMGKSGSGKSTLMNLLGCLDTPTSGTYALDGNEVSQLDDNALSALRAQKLGFVFQQYNLLPRQTALSNVELPLRYSGSGRHGDRRERARALSFRRGHFRGGFVPRPASSRAHTFP